MIRLIRALHVSLHAALVAIVLLLPAGQARGDEALHMVRVRFDAGARQQNATGRIIIFMLKEGARVPKGARPADAPFYDDPQPIFSIGVTDLPPGAVSTIDDEAVSFPAPLSRLPAGKYRVQAVLDVGRSNSDWSREPGNLYSEIIEFSHEKQGDAIDLFLTMNELVEDVPPRIIAPAEAFETPSPLMQQFLNVPRVMLRAAVLPPRTIEPGRRYPAVYIVPGFGGDHRMINMYARRRGGTFEGSELFDHAYIIALDPESAHGHTLFADSANNGPRGKALVSELIPALEAAYPLIQSPSARIVHGHSSGGWSAVWLPITYPEVFGFGFAGAPDPLSFDAFQKIDLYQQPNFYTDEQGHELGSNVQDGTVLMTIRQENLWEEARGPRNMSGQQWDSWQAVFGPRGPAGRPAALFDPITGVIDQNVARQYEAYDIVKRLKADPARLAPLFRDRVQIIVGGEDEWNLHVGVERLRDALQAHDVMMDGKASRGSIIIVPGADHSSVTASPAYRAIFGAMLRTFREHGHAP